MGSAQDSFRLLSALAIVDGELHANEKPVLLAFAKGVGLTVEDAQALLREVQGGKLGVRPPDDPAERRALYDAMLKLAGADGRLHPKQRDLLLRLGPPLGVPVEEVQQDLKQFMYACPSEEPAPSDGHESARGSGADDAEPQRPKAPRAKRARFWETQSPGETTGFSPTQAFLPALVWLGLLLLGVALASLASRTTGINPRMLLDPYSTWMAAIVALGGLKLARVLRGAPTPPTEDAQSD